MENDNGEDFESFDLPGFGTSKFRRGSAHHEFAGAISFWHRKSKRAFHAGLIRGALIVLSAEGLAWGIHHWLR